MNTEQPAASQTVSHTAPQEAQASPQSPAQPSQQPQPTQSQIGQGNVPSSFPAARDGPHRVLVSPTGIPLARGPDGRLYNPAKGEPPPKAQSSAPTDSRKTLQRTDLEQADTLKGGIQGLDSIPKDWPELPGNVSLGVEIAWVQANRLYVVKEQATGRIKVDLSKARVPAPSAAALSWLETSIRSYAKFVEVASKQAGSGQDEAEFVRKERMQIGEIRAILAEMLVDKQG